MLHVLPRDGGSYGVELWERVNGGAPQGRLVVRIWGPPFQVAVDQVLEALRRSGQRASDLHRGRKTPLELNEPSGVRVALLLMALKPLRKSSRMEAVASAIREMSEEEAYYWFAKARESASAQRALRILAAGDRR
ncbi:MAG: hypothetical protein KatS3mg081_0124 [Gemmatimonadales bacterium]|nr:MAG: hypothetical protein KatS3mg081_0124 [Gemmatimonadales bacterium]